MTKYFQINNAFLNYKRKNDGFNWYVQIFVIVLIFAHTGIFKRKKKKNMFPYPTASRVPQLKTQQRGKRTPAFNADLLLTCCPKALFHRIKQTLLYPVLYIKKISK